MAQFEREQVFWDERVADLSDCLSEYRAGPDPNTERAINYLLPLDGVTVLDVGCGAGVFAAWLAKAGARVVGIDVSTRQLARAAELHTQLGHDSRFVASSVSRGALGGETFDRIAGRYVLHHLDPPAIAGELAALLHGDGKAAFVETVGLNPLLRFARARLAGRYRIPRYGTADERPLTHVDLSALASAFGELRLETAEMQFLRIFDRQVFHYRSRRFSRVLGAIDDTLNGLRLGRLSYHQIVLLAQPHAN